MRFYYISIISVILLAVIYFIGTGLLVLLGSWLRKRWNKAWMVMVPLFLLLYFGPIAEELWIAWNFGQLCRKDAGIFIHKVVEVEGFYDATAGLLTASTPVPEPAADYYEKGGFRFYELSLANTQGGPSRVVHYEKVKGVWTPTVIEKPTARYHYRWPDFNTPVGHKIYKQSEAVIDTDNGEVLGGSTGYGRKSPWFFVALDDPGMSCPRPGEDPLKKPGLLYKHILNASK